MTKKVWFLIVIIVAALTVAALQLYPHLVLARHFGENCKFAGYCGEMYAVSCGISDGDFYYVDSESEKVATCGGACWVDKTNYCQENCPPKKWTCPPWGNK